MGLYCGGLQDAMKFKGWGGDGEGLNDERGGEGQGLHEENTMARGGEVLR